MQNGSSQDFEHVFRELHAVMVIKPMVCRTPKPLEPLHRRGAASMQGQQGRDPVQ